MCAVCRRGMTTRTRFIVWPLLLLVGCIFTIRNWAEGSHQPVNYSHRQHVTELEIDCLDCHANVEQGARAAIPNIETCGACHVDTEAENVEIRKVAAYASREELIPWQQVHMVPDHVYFSHRRHVKLAGIGCIECHGDVAQMENAFFEPFQSIEMEWCTDCHRQRGVTNDCYSCHR